LSVSIDLPSGSGSVEGVLVANDVVVRKGNGEGYDPKFRQPLHEGVEFKVIERRGGWLRIELADGNQGWVRVREVELL
jgi:SH3-like domain-containing protein